MRWFKFIPHDRAPFWRGQVIAVACAGAGLLMRLPLAPVLGAASPFITFPPFVLIAAIWGGTPAGVSALILSALAASLLFDATAAVPTAPWASAAAFLLSGGLLVLIGALLRALVGALARSEAQARMLSHEMKHRAGNVIGVALAMARQTARTAPDLARFLTDFEGRMMALGAAQELAAGDPDAPADLRALLERVLAPFDPARMSLTGPPAAVPADVGSSLALVVHELGTNAAKYGALSAPDGRVSIAWSLSGGEMALEWREAGGPPVAQPTREGFGGRLLRTAFAPKRGAALVEYAPEGVRCVVRAAIVRAAPKPALAG